MSQSGFEEEYLAQQLAGKGTRTPTQMADGIYHIQSLGNIGFIVDQGITVIDTGSPLDPTAVLEGLRIITQEPIVRIILTHGHVDHAANTLPLLKETEQRGEDRPSLLAHRNVLLHMQRYKETAGLQDRVNRIQFGLSSGHSGWPPDEHFIRPDQIYDQPQVMRQGRYTLELYPGSGETDDATWIFVPEQEAIFSGDFFISSCPNIGNPLKVQRYELEWAIELEKMVEKNAVVLGPGHGPVLFGKDRIKDALQTTATALRYLHNAVIDRLNAGQTGDQIRREVHLPPTLAGHWALRPVYGCPEFIVMGICRRYTGWYDGNPSHLFPSSPQEIAHEIVALCGDDALLMRAKSLVEENNHQLALHLLDFLLNTDGKLIQQATELKDHVLVTFSQQAESYIAKNILQYGIKNG